MSATGMANVKKTVLGIAVNEGVRVGLRRILPNNKRERFVLDSVPLDSSNVVDSLKSIIKDAYYERLGLNGAFKLDAIAISMIGLINSETNEIEAIARPGWVLKKGSLSYNFAELIAESLPEHRHLTEQDETFSLINDTTACAFGERKFGVGCTIQGERLHRNSFAYLRVGEGVNAGFVSGTLDDMWSGQLHPEFGHIRPAPFRRLGQKMPSEELPKFPGVCRRHGDCLEGLISRAALFKRWGREPSDALWEEPLALESTAFYIAHACSIITMTISPIRIAIGGSSVSKTLIDRVKAYFEDIVRGYPVYRSMKNTDEYLKMAACNGSENIWGTLVVAEQLAMSKVKGPRGL